MFFFLQLSFLTISNTGMKKTQKFNLSRQLLTSMLVAVFVFAPLDLHHFSVSSTFAADSEFDWIDDEGFQHIDGEVTWAKGDHVIEKGLFVEGNGVLRIEKGARILFANIPDNMNSMSVSGNGQIIAIGSQDEKISFSSTDADGLWSIFLGADDSVQTSFFRFVEFNGIEIPSVDDENGIVMLRNLLMKTALAATPNFSKVFVFSSGKVHVENSTFKNGAVFADLFVGTDFNVNSSLEIVNSNFDLSSQGVAVDSHLRCTDEISDADCKKHVLLKNDWFGHFLGPNVGGSSILDGVKLEGKCFLDGWRANDLIADPVLIVPGIMGAGQFLGKWQLDPISHTYDDMVSSLEKNGFTKEVNLFDFPFDWRRNNETTARFLQSRIEGIVNDTRISKVDVVAHSMGGLVARAYVEEIQGAQYAETIDELITLGTPQHGSPAAFLKWEAAEGFFSISDKLAKHHFKQEAEHEGFQDLQKYVQERVTSVKELLPDYSYLQESSNGDLRAYPENYPRNTFLEDLNDETNLEKMKKVQHINIVGNLENDNSTISKIRVRETSVIGKWEHGMPENFYDTETDMGLINSNGDETVPLFSAKEIPANKQIEVNALHGSLPDLAQCEIFKELTGKTECDFVDKWRVTNVLLFNVFSPIDIQIVSPSGKRVGKNFETGGTFNEIEGAFYSGFETDNEFVTIPNPENGEYRILTEGTGDGNFRVEAVKISQDPLDETQSSETVAVINGVATVGAAKELKVSVVGNDVTEADSQIVPTDPIDPPTTPEIPPVLPPPTTPVVLPSTPEAPNLTPAPLAIKKENGGSSHKKSKKKHKKKVKKTKVAKAVTKVKKVLGVSKTLKVVSKKTSKSWQSATKTIKSWKDVILSPLKYFKK